MASKRRLRRIKCGNKKKYKDQAEAVSFLIYMKKNKEKILSSYKCKYCGNWHVGNFIKQDRANLKKRRGHIRW